MAGNEGEGNRRENGVTGTDAGGGEWIIGTNTDGPTVIDPAKIGSGESGSEGGTGEPAKRGRGRPRGSGGGSSSKKKATSDLSGLEKLLFSLHAMGAHFLKTPELELDKEEAALYAKAANDVARHYNIGVSEKAEAWIAFAFAVSGIYGPRIVALRARLETERKEKQQKPKPVNPVVNMNDLTRPMNFTGA